MSEDDPEFQGLLENKVEAAYPNISAEPLGVELESQEADYAAVTDDPEPDFKQLATAALDNAGIDPQDRLCMAQAVQAAGAAGSAQGGPALVEVNEDKIVYEIKFDFLDAGLAGGNVVPDDTPPPPPVEASIIGMANKMVEISTNTDAITTNQRYPL